MNGNPGSPPTPKPKQPCTPDRVAATVASYAIAFISIAVWSVLVFSTGAFVYVVSRAIIWAVKGACKVLGV